MNYYCVLAILALAVVSSVQAIENLFAKYDKECRNIFHASSEEVDKFFDATLEEASDALKCHFKCIMEKEGSWRNGYFEPPELLDNPELQDYLNDCKNIRGYSDCDTAYLIVKCLRDDPIDFEGLDFEDDS